MPTDAATPAPPTPGAAATVGAAAAAAVAAVAVADDPLARGYRLVCATALHRGDRAYQQDQVEILRHARVPGCVFAVLADGMGGKSGGRKAADQVLLTARQLFDRHVPSKDEADTLLGQLVAESHLMIRLTAITAEEEPHSTVAAFLLGPQLECSVVHAGDSRVYHFRQGEMRSRTMDHSYVQRLIDEGRLTEAQALSHPQANLLTGCLGAATDPPMTLRHLEPLRVGDAMLACSDGLWHHFSPRELGLALVGRAPREAAELLVHLARQRASGQGDNVSLAIVRVEPLD